MNRTMGIAFALLISLIAVPTIRSGLSTRAEAGTSQCAHSTLTGGYGVMGPGTTAGQPIVMIGAFFFDGAGKFTASGKFVGQDVNYVEPFTISDGTYSLNSDCTGTFSYFLHHENLSAADHFHQMYTVVTGSGQRFSSIYTHLQVAKDGPSIPVETFTVSGDRM